jgi:hypothetical protein
VTNRYVSWCQFPHNTEREFSQIDDWDYVFLGSTTSCLCQLIVLRSNSFDGFIVQLLRGQKKRMGSQIAATFMKMSMLWPQIQRLSIPHPEDWTDEGKHRSSLTIPEPNRPTLQHWRWKSELFNNRCSLKSKETVLALVMGCRHFHRRCDGHANTLTQIWTHKRPFPQSCLLVSCIGSSKCLIAFNFHSFHFDLANCASDIKELGRNREAEICSEARKEW